MPAARRAFETGRAYPLPVLVLFGLVTALVVHVSGQSGAANDVLLITLVGCGLPVVARTLWGMAHGRFAADVVASLAIVGAAITNEYLAGCVIVLMQTGGEALEQYAVRRASSSLEKLLERAPHTAHRKQGDRIEDIPVSEVALNDHIVVRPGEVIPVNAVVLAGGSAVDESALTGEPIPVNTGPGREVLSGSICVDGALELQALRTSSDSEYQQIVRLVREAQGNKAPIGRLADRYAVFFTPLTLLMCGVAYALTSRPEAVVAVLVVATPCPLILATPVAIISGINRAAGRGILVKGGIAIEQVGQADVVVFDKTGTLTTGNPAVQHVLPLDGYSPVDILRLAAGLEQFSGHPMARALAAAGSAQFRPLPLPTDVTEVPGQGVTGYVDGHEVEVGSVAFAAREQLGSLDKIDRARRDIGAEDDAVAVVGIDGRAVGLVTYADPIRPAAAQVMKRLEALGVRETAMVTGDDAATAQVVASAVGIERVLADLLPGQKVEAVADLAKRYRTVVMVGDGINDAPALAAATVGIALAAHGAAVSAEAADIVVTTDDLARVGDAVEIGRHTLHIAKQSIWAGLGLSGAMMVFAAFGYIPPTLGAFLQEALDVAVIFNALRAR